MIAQNPKEIALAIVAFRRKIITFDNWLAETSPRLQWNLPHLKFMRRYLERIIAGERLKIMFFLPVQHGKSTQNTIHFGAYYLYKHPENNIILAAYNSNFANQFSFQMRKLIQKYEPLEVKGITEWGLAKGGRCRATGINSGITGHSADLIIIDDPIKSREEAYSRIYRDNLWNSWQYELKTRITNNTSVIFTMTRWHYDDLAARLLESEDDWIVVSLPALAEEADPLKRKPGAALWPAQFSVDRLNKIKQQNPSVFAALYQQKPARAEGNMIKRAWFKYYKQLPKIDFKIQTIDTAFKTGEANDYSVIETWGTTNHGHYLIDIWRGKEEFPEFLEVVKMQAAKHKPQKIYIEDKAGGQDLIPVLKRSTTYPIEPFKPIGAKEVRVAAATPTFEAGRIYLPEDHYLLADVVDELVDFPTAPHDDIVDTTTMAIKIFEDFNVNWLEGMTKL